MSKGSQPAFTNWDEKNDHASLDPTWCANNSGLVWHPHDDPDPDGVVPRPDRPSSGGRANRSARAVPPRTTARRGSTSPAIGFCGRVASAQPAGNSIEPLTQSLPVNLASLAGSASQGTRGVHQPRRGWSATGVRVARGDATSSIASRTQRCPVGIQFGNRASQSSGPEALGRSTEFVHRQPVEQPCLQRSAGSSSQPLPGTITRWADRDSGGGSLWASLWLRAQRKRNWKLEHGMAPGVAHHPVTPA